MPRRVYAGTRPVAFTAVGTVVPGQEIEVPEALLPGFDRRADITMPEPRRARGRKNGGEQAAAAVPAATGETGEG